MAWQLSFQTNASATPALLYRILLQMHCPFGLLSQVCNAICSFTTPRSESAGVLPAASFHSAARKPTRFLLIFCSPLLPQGLRSGYLLAQSQAYVNMPHKCPSLCETAITDCSSFHPRLVALVTAFSRSSFISFLRKIIPYYYAVFCQTFILNCILIILLI